MLSQRPRPSESWADSADGLLQMAGVLNSSWDKTGWNVWLVPIRSCTDGLDKSVFVFEQGAPAELKAAPLRNARFQSGLDVPKPNYDVAQNTCNNAYTGFRLY
jgi:hypothetical protein